MISFIVDLMQGAKGHNEMHPPGGLTEKRGDICGVSEQEIAHTAPHKPPSGLSESVKCNHNDICVFIKCEKCLWKVCLFENFWCLWLVRSMCVFSLHADWPLCTLTCTQRIQKPTSAISKKCICLLQHAVDFFYAEYCSFMMCGSSITLSQCHTVH